MLGRPSGGLDEFRRRFDRCRRPVMENYGL